MVDVKNNINYKKWSERMNRNKILFTIFFFSVFYGHSSVIQASNNSGILPEIIQDDDIRKHLTEEGELQFQYKPDYEDFSNFLGISEKKYFELRKGKSMLEIAEKQNISKDELYRYWVLKYFEALDTHHQEGKIDHWFIMNYTLRLKEDIEWLMTVKSIK